MWTSSNWRLILIFVSCIATELTGSDLLERDPQFVCGFESPFQTPLPVNDNFTLLVGVGFLKAGTTRIGECLRNETSLSLCSPPRKELRFLHSKAVASCTRPSFQLLNSTQTFANDLCGLDRQKELRTEYVHKLLPHMHETDGLGSLKCTTVWEFTPGYLQGTPSTLCALRFLKHLFPSVTVIVSLRDEVDRAHSQQNMWLKRRCRGTERNALVRCSDLTAETQLQFELDFIRHGKETSCQNLFIDPNVTKEPFASFLDLSRCNFALAKALSEHPALFGTCNWFPRPTGVRLPQQQAGLPNCPAPVLIQSHYAIFLQALLKIFGERGLIIIDGAAAGNGGHDSDVFRKSYLGLLSVIDKHG